MVSLTAANSGLSSMLLVGVDRAHDKNGIMMIFKAVLWCCLMPPIALTVLSLMDVASPDAAAAAISCGIVLGNLCWSGVMCC